MAIRIVTQEHKFSEFTRDDWIVHAALFCEDRRGTAGAGPDEAVVGYIDGFRGVYIRPGAVDPDETWFVWFVTPGRGRSARVVNMLSLGVYVDAQDGTVIEWDPSWVIRLGTVTRIGGALLTKDMLRG